jgi:alkanesulfonate monooxygenase SsuD/methylene tetrahydromethanopterin reductase-like flavin-dependent oxidoreductase (luciferase family)
MKIGYVCNPGASELTGPYQDVIGRVREIAQHCDETGFDSIWFTEHHFGYYGRANLPNPVMMGADIAARTHRIRIGLASATIPFWHPIRLAEDLALLDQFSEGRLELGVGRGNHGVEALNLNPTADPRSPSDNYAVFAETLEILKRAFSQPTFSFQGEKYRFPAPGFTWDRAHTVDNPDYVDRETGEVIKLSIIPRPIQQPYPPLWQMVDSGRSIEFAAKNDLGIIMWRPPVDSLKEHFEQYRTTAAASGRNLAPGQRAGVMRDMFVASSMAEAERLAGSYVMRTLNWSNWRGPSIYLKPGEVLDEETEAALKKELPFDWVQPRSLLFGSPEAVVDQLLEMREALNIECVLVTSDWTGMPHELTMQSLRLFSEKVLPRIAS